MEPVVPSCPAVGLPGPTGPRSTAVARAAHGSPARSAARSLRPAPPRRPLPAARLGTDRFGVIGPRLFCGSFVSGRNSQAGSSRRVPRLCQPCAYGRVSPASTRLTQPWHTAARHADRCRSLAVFYGTGAAWPGERSGSPSATMRPISSPSGSRGHFPNSGDGWLSRGVRTATLKRAGVGATQAIEESR